MMKSGDGDNGGIIIGTGKLLEGTATSNRLFASNMVELRSISGERSTGSFSDQGRFMFDALEGEGPFLLRSDLGNGNFLYGFTADASGDELVQNIHSYSDAVIRSWYNTQGMDIDAVFASAGTAPVPSSVQANAIYDSLIAVVTDVLDNYGFTGANLNTAEFVANGTGIDGFILQNPIIQSDGSITLSIFDPANNTASVAVDNFNLSTDLTTADTVAPSAPTDLRALPSASDEITLVWEVASDDFGIARYSVRRNGQEIGTSPYPVFVDGGLAANSVNTYSVVAIDSAGNASAASLSADASPLGAVDTMAPPTPSSVLIDTRRGSLD